ncbi:class I SAM-dependent methyltransferase [Streptomyces sp. NA02950]|uniref:methyltransferase n=1 Tax=Streptomyces sp. NA02950 TaxID=2742137 RepID=UPI0015917C11|nr:class I SAM-dependent methyltransferase [Streptomyces sp. NA02950]QKV94919.1 class I SAM-dependent methyltransferase [Streptomyces sp. NA02950]
MSRRQVVRWTEADEDRSARWCSEGGTPPPEHVVIADERMTADTAYRLACDGTALLWRDDFQSARALLREMKQRADQALRRRKLSQSPSEAFCQYRQARSERADTLGMLLVPFERNGVIPLRRAPDVQQACREAYGPGDEPFVASLRELLHLIWAHEQRQKGFEVPALGDRIHPHYGVFTPVLRGEYMDLVAEAPLPSRTLAFDVGTGTGVLTAILARRGVKRIVATDQEPRALACAQENLTRLGLADRVEFMQTDLFPPGRAALVVCNPPWVPGQPHSPVERAMFDPESRMLRGFLSGLAAHLEPGGEGWLVISDFAEHVGLRPRAELLAAFDAAGLKVVARTDVRPRAPHVSDDSDPFPAVSAVEVTSLWRLTLR